MTKHMTIKLVG